MGKEQPQYFIRGPVMICFVNVSGDKGGRYYKAQRVRCRIAPVDATSLRPVPCPKLPSISVLQVRKTSVGNARNKICNNPRQMFHYTRGAIRERVTNVP